MIFEFATKRDINGNRYYLGFDPVKKVYSRERGKWYSREDIIEISKTDRRELINKLEAAGFTEIDHF